MKTRILFFIFSILFFCIKCSSPEKQTNLEKTVKELEHSFKTQSIKFVEPYLADNFVINDFNPIVSKSFLGGIVSSLPVKKIKNIEIISRNKDTLFVNCDLVINKFLGLFSETLKLKMLETKDTVYLLKMDVPIGNVNMNVSVSLGNDTTSKQINLNNFSCVKNKKGLTYYDKGLEYIAKEVNQNQIKGINFVNEILGEKLSFPIGLLLINDSLQNTNIGQALMPVAINSKTFETDTLTNFFLNWAYFHELVEIHLVVGKFIKDPNTRWFREGLAEFVAHEVARKLNPKTDKIMISNRMKSYEKIGKKANLLNWIGTGDENIKRQGVQGGNGQYTAAMLFFIDLTNDYGKEIIPKVLTKLSGCSNIDSKIIIKELSILTGENIENRIKKY